MIVIATYLILGVLEIVVMVGIAIATRVGPTHPHPLGPSRRRPYTGGNGPELR